MQQYLSNSVGNYWEHMSYTILSCFLNLPSSQQFWTRSPPISLPVTACCPHWPNGRRYYVAQGMYSTTTECVSCRTQLQQSGFPEIYGWSLPSHRLEVWRDPNDVWQGRMLHRLIQVNVKIVQCHRCSSTDSGSLTSELAIPRGTTSWIWHLVAVLGMTLNDV